MKDEVVKKLVEYLQKTEDFILAEAPEVLIQALNYNKAKCIVDISFLSVFLVILLCSVFYTTMYPKFDSFGYRQFPYVIIPTMGSVFSFINVFSLLCEIQNLMKIIMAPKYFLIQLFIKYCS